MSGYQKITIVLKDSNNHVEYNKRILEYLVDRHTILNDNMYTIAMDVVDDTNIDDFVKRGVQSIPAMQVVGTNDYVYGVNSILSSLAKLEMPQAVAPRVSSFQERSQSQEEKSSSSYYNMVMEEMKNDEQEDPDTPSTLKAYRQDLPEAPLTEKAIEEKSKAYNRIYEQRKNRNAMQKPASKEPPKKTAGVDVDKFIESGGYDKGEELFMRQIAQNLL